MLKVQDRYALAVSELLGCQRHTYCSANVCASVSVFSLPMTGYLEIPLSGLLLCKVTLCPSLEANIELSLPKCCTTHCKTDSTQVNRQRCCSSGLNDLCCGQTLSSRLVMGWYITRDTIREQHGSQRILIRNVREFPSPDSQSSALKQPKLQAYNTLWLLWWCIGTHELNKQRGRKHIYPPVLVKS